MKPAEYPRPVRREVAARGWVVAVWVLLGLGGFAWFARWDKRGAVIIEPRATCLSTIKHPLLAAMMYGGDYDDRLPPLKRWIDELTPYSKSEGAFHCQHPGRKEPYGYAANSLMAGLRIEDLDWAADSIMVFDSTSSFRNACDPLSSLWPTGRPNVAYLDGHTAAFKRRRE